MIRSKPINLIIALGAFNAFIAVAAGAFAAHGLRDILSTEYLNTFKTAADYQLIHGVGLILIGLINRQNTSRRTVHAGRHYIIQRQPVPADTYRYTLARHHHPVWRRLFSDRLADPGL